ncbi:MAG: type II toxin-antitoxin system RelE/ParE family toxin [Acidobacteria bacterium]|nr:type II toxin-antitoxin system RelE/ParE family toxin [Acidobacteriota bacterium]
MRQRFHPEALEEFEQAAVYYEQQEPGLGDHFIQVIETAIESIINAPEMWPILETPIRRRLTRTFPYAVLYAIDADHLLIIAIMHCSRQPDYWRSRTS